MPFEKPEFDLDYNRQPGNMVTDPRFSLRVRFHNALLAHLAPAPMNSSTDALDKARKIAQELTFIPVVNRGWPPGNSELNQLAKDLVDSYQLLRDAFADANFLEPSHAALNELKHYEFTL